MDSSFLRGLSNALVGQGGITFIFGVSVVFPPLA